MQYARGTTKLNDLASLQGVLILMDHFTQHIQDFRDHLKYLGRSPNTFKAYGSGIQHLVCWLKDQGVDRIQDLTSERSKVFVRQMIEKVHQARLSQATLDIHLRGVRRFLEYLELTHRILINPLKEVTLPKWNKYRKLKSVLNESEMERLIQSANSEETLGMRDRAILEVLYSTGIRRSELVHLDIEDIDTKGGYLRIRSGKGGKDRILPLGEKACDAVQRYLGKARYLFAGEVNEERALFITQRGSRMDLSLQSLFRKYTLASRIQKRVSAHTFRRCFATHLLKRGASPYHVKELLGHSDLKSLDRYIELAPVDLKKVHEKTHPRDSGT